MSKLIDMEAHDHGSARAGADPATKNILVNAIGPALTETKLTREYLSDQHFRQNAIDAIPMQRLGQS